VLLHYLAEHGDFHYEPGATFLYYHAPGLASEGGAMYRDHGFFGCDVTAWTAATVVMTEHAGGSPLERLRLRAALFVSLGSLLRGGPYGWAKYYVDRLYWKVPAIHSPWRAFKRRWNGSHPDRARDSR